MIAPDPLGRASAELNRIVLRRDVSLFDDDLRQMATVVRERIEGARVLVIGGGGTIGAASAELLFDYAPKSVSVVDLSENYLVELVRSLRGRPGGVGGAEVLTFPLDYGGPIMARLLANTPPFDIVLNFAALKHVRSEKDVYSLLQMLNTNIVAHARFKKMLQTHGHDASYFAVSTDKAANPSSMMGASKRLAEEVMFDLAAETAKYTTSVRFANVAFSNGSLLQGFLYRLAERQPLAAPQGSRRYFVSEREAAQLCILAAFAAPDQHIAFPRLDAEKELQEMPDIAVRVLAAAGYKAEFYDDEAAATRDIEGLRQTGRWPLLLTPLDTSGEKPFEEFVGGDEVEQSIGLRAVSAVKHVRCATDLPALLSVLQSLTDGDAGELDKRDLVAIIADAVPTLVHKETDRNLDQRL